MISPGTEHLDNRLPGRRGLLRVIHGEPWHNANWRRPETASEVIACNRIDSDLKRIVLLQESWEIERACKRSGF